MTGERLDAQPMRDKTCLVTGATAGIGRATAAELARMGARVIIHGRSAVKTVDAVNAIREETGNERVDHVLADFADLDQVRKMAVDVMEKTDCLHVLVNNAGAFFSSRQTTELGVEKTFLVNYLAPFLLTNLLIDTVHAGGRARIINLSSEGHRQDDMNLDDLSFERFYFGMKAYARSKLGNLMFTYELARRLEGSMITVNAVHPGHVASDIWRASIPLFGPVLQRIMGLFAISPVEGARTSVYLASSSCVDGVTGRYFSKCEPILSSPRSTDPELAGRLWAISESLVCLDGAAEI